ncbi:MAG: hypothetical protein B5766_06045 [Candidatus Lumbricidophila eiseniae]|uniref:Iron ABC transporter permease n=1 Tax=Candidatus Lumbricidiphila eiseniae TaxID=1969409 RepID=A0A2A6FR74_9MICO|nr:MAG: hypothetical protein B5766_06045 [Candidatus Lumbricidophila eiseniae]
MTGWRRVAGGTGCSADGHVPALRLSALRAGARHRAILVAGLCVAGVVGLAFTALLLGATSLPATRVVATLFGGGDPGEQLIVLGLRAPRIAAALLAGVGFAMAGATFQSLLHNPLASPDILGISGGASLGALVCLLVLGATGPLVALGAFAGAMGVAFVIWAVAWNRGLHGIRFVLVGVGVAYLCGALVGWLIASANVRVALSAFQWTVGSVADVRGDSLGLLTVGTAVCAGWVLVRSRMLRPLVLGDDRARSLGVRVNAARGELLGAAVLLVALATSVTGPISFIALCAPAIARRLVGHGSAAVGTAGVIGAALTLAADVAGQFAIPGLVAPVGIVTGILGAPYVLWLLARTDRRGPQ